MAIKIQTKQTSIPVEIGDLKFDFDVTDESVKNFHKNAENIQKEIENIDLNTDDENSFEQAKEVLDRGFTVMLGEGTFDKIYEMSPSLMICLQYLQAIGDGLYEEFDKMGFGESAQEKAKKYIQNKNKKKKK